MRLGQYEFEERDLLGEGAFGKVYKGKDVTSGDVVAIKRLKLETKEQRTSAKNELRPLVALRDSPHKHVVMFFEDKKMHDSLWLVLEYCSGGTLNDFLLNQPNMPVSMKMRLMTEIADAVSFLHSNNIVHRDLKPDNILLSGSHDNPIVKVADFGLAKVCGVGDKALSKYYMGTLCGTLLFLAPEVFSGQKYKMYCDVFSMGVIFVAMLEGRQVENNVAAFIGPSVAPVPIGQELSSNPTLNLSAHLLTKKKGPLKNLCLSMLSAEYRDRPNAEVVHRSLIDMQINQNDKIVAEQKNDKSWLSDILPAVCMGLAGFLGAVAIGLIVKQKN